MPKHFFDLGGSYRRRFLHPDVQACVKGANSQFRMKLGGYANKYGFQIFIFVHRFGVRIDCLHPVLGGGYSSKVLIFVANSVQFDRQIGESRQQVPISMGSCSHQADFEFSAVFSLIAQ